MENTLKLHALSLDKLIALLKQAGSRTISEETLSNDLENGAPQNPDGTFNFVHYAAWLAKQNGGESDYGLYVLPVTFANFSIASAMMSALFV